MRWRSKCKSLLLARWRRYQLQKWVLTTSGLKWVLYLRKVCFYTFVEHLSSIASAVPGVPCRLRSNVCKMLYRVVFCALCVVSISFAFAVERWSVEKAATWLSKVGWKAGANFVPSTAVNELEMFQADTFDLVTIDRELGYAENLGFGVIRVFLHNLLWTQEGFLQRVDKFLDVADKHHISVMFVLLDSCWLPSATTGPQPAPIPGVHNSQWVQAPGSAILYDNTQFDALQPYIQGVVHRFKDDRRVLAWDIWNEPDNSGYSDERISPLLVKVAGWVKGANPSQPITTPVWTNPSSADYTAFQKTQMDHSDVISFHSYEDAAKTQQAINNFQEYGEGRPVICTEYMARAQNSTFQPHMQIMKDANVIAINWGLVSGE